MRILFNYLKGNELHFSFYDLSQIRYNQVLDFFEGDYERFF